MTTETDSDKKIELDSKPRREIKKPPVLFQQTQEIIARIEALLDGSLLTYWNSPNGSI